MRRAGEEMGCAAREAHGFQATMAGADGGRRAQLRSRATLCALGEACGRRACVSTAPPIGPGPTPVQLVPGRVE